MFEIHSQKLKLVHAVIAVKSNLKKKKKIAQGTDGSRNRFGRQTATSKKGKHPPQNKTGFSLL